MENPKKTDLYQTFSFFSSYLLELIDRTSNFCSLVQQNQKITNRLEKKLSIYEKFQGLNRLAPIDLEKLERHLLKGLDMVKEEKIKRKYEDKIAELQAKIGEIPQITPINSSLSLKKVNDFDEICEDFLTFVKEITILQKELTNLTDIISQEELTLLTIKKNKKLNFPLEETIKELNYSNNNENLATKVSSFGDENVPNSINNQKKAKNEIFLIHDILNSQRLETDINEKMKKSLQEKEFIRNEEHSPDFLFRPKLIKDEINLSLEIEKSKKKEREKKSKKNLSMNLIACSESIDFSFEEEKKINLRDDFGEVLMFRSIDDMNKVKENKYLKKLKKEVMKK